MKAFSFLAYNHVKFDVSGGVKVIKFRIRITTTRGCRRKVISSFNCGPAWNGINTFVLPGQSVWQEGHMDESVRSRMKTS